MKFLAVLAVLAMAFAAFAVVAPAETDDAGANDPAITGLTPVEDGAILNLLGGSTNTYYVNSDISVTIALRDTSGNVDRAHAVQIVLLNGHTLKVKAGEDGAGTALVAVWSTPTETLNTGKYDVGALSAEGTALEMNPNEFSAFKAVKESDGLMYTYTAPTGQDLRVNMSEMRVTGDFSTYPIKLLQNIDDSSILAKDLTAIVKTMDGDTELKVTNFNGKLKTVSGSPDVIAIEAWTSGNIEIVKAASATPVDVKAGGNSSSILTIDANAFAKLNTGFAFNLNATGAGKINFTGNVGDGSTACTITSTATIVANSAITITNKAVLNAPISSSVAATNTALTISQGGVFNGKLTITTDSHTAEATMKLKGGADGITIKVGSIQISGAIDGTDSSIAQINGDVYLGDGTSSVTVVDGAALTLSKTLKVKKTLTVEGTLKTATGSTLDLSDTTTDPDASVAVNGTLNIGGTVIQGDRTDNTITGGGEVSIGANADVTSVKFDNHLNIEADPNAMTEMTVGGMSDSSITKIGPTQIVKVSGSWTLVKGAEFTIMGELQVPAGTTLTIQEGAKLIIDAGAKAELKGTVLIAAAVGTTAAGELEIKNYGSADVYGKFTVNGFLTITKGELTIMEGSDFTVSKTGKIDEAANGLVVVSKGAVLTNNGVIKIADQTKGIQNSGTVVYNSNEKAESAATIFMMANDAIVDIEKYTVASANANTYTITIKDEGLVYYNDKVNDKKYAVGIDIGVASFRTAVNTIVINLPTITPGDTASAGPATDVVGKIFGVMVVEKVSSYSAETNPFNSNGFVAVAEKIFTNKMDLSGELAVSAVHTEGQVSNQSATGSVTITAGQEVDITDSFTVGVNTTLTNAATENDYGKLVVSGTVDATADATNATAAAMTNAGIITLSGDGIISKVTNTLGGTVNAVMFETGTVTPIYNYVTIDSALAIAGAIGNTIDEFYVLGTDTVTVSATIPENVSFILSGATLYIGSKAGDDVTLTVKEDGTFMGGTRVIVNGTLFAENKTNVVITGNNIVSDVLAQEIGIDGKVVSDGWARWTNITAALNQAEPGSVVTISKATDGNDYVVITGNTEIKNGVTLVVPSNVAPLKLKDGVTLTINGELVTALDIYAETKFDFTARNLTGTDGKASAIVVNGALEMDSILALPYGAGVGNQITLGAPIVGAYYNIDGYRVISPLDVALYNIDDVLSKITINGPVTGGDLIFTATDYVSEIVIGNDTIGTVVSSLTVTSLTLDGAKLGDNGTTFGAFSGKLKVGDNVITAVGIKNLKVQDKSDKMLLTSAAIPKDMKLNISSGAVYTSGLSISTVPGTFTVDAGASLIADGGADAATAIEKLTVNGTLSVPNAKVLAVTDLTLYGTLDVAPATSTKTAGSMSVKNMFVGLKKGDYYSTSAAAVISGPFNANANGVIVILDGTTIDSAAQEVLDGMAKNSKFYVEGKLWITVYTPTAGTTIVVNKAPIEDAILEGWGTKAGASITDSGSVAKNSEITIGNKAAYYAIVDYDIYNVTIITDTGIKSVAIDGIEMIRDGSSNLFITGLYGIDGNLTLGRELVAGTHTVSYTLYNGYEGTAQLYTADNTILKDLKFTLSGTDNLDSTFQLKGTEQIVTPEPSPVEQNEWTITTILLVILVILIAIMAVIVALRLNRS